MQRTKDVKNLLLSDAEDEESIRRQLLQLTIEERHAIIEQAKATLSRDDFITYCAYVHDWKLAPHQREWAEMMQQSQRLCIVAPPESGKSRLMRSWIEWRIGKDPNIAILLVQNTSRQATLQVAAVANVLLSDRYQKVFPHIKSTEKWSGEKIFVQRTTFRPDATLAGYGIDGAYQGAHVDIIVVDDPTDQKDVYSAVVMQSQKDVLRGVLYDRLKENGNFFIIFTRWGDNDLLETVEVDLQVEIHTYPAFRDELYAWDSHYLWESQYSEERLKEQERAKGPDLFKLTFLCSSAGAIRGKRVYGMLNKNVHFKKITATMLSEIHWLKSAMGVDWGTTVAHQSAVVTAMQRTDKVVVVRGAWMSPKGSSSELLDAAAQQKLALGVRRAWIDRSQGSLKDQFEYQLGMAAFKGEASVDMRIGALLTLIDAGMFIIDQNAEGNAITELWNQLTSYAYDENGRVIERNDDLVDALLYALAALTEPRRSGLGPMVEIVPKAKPDDMTDAMHDGFDPSKWTEDGTGRKHSMQDYSNLI